MLLIPLAARAANTVMNGTALAGKTTETHGHTTLAAHLRSQFEASSRTRAVLAAVSAGYQRQR